MLAFELGEVSTGAEILLGGAAIQQQNECLSAVPPTVYRRPGNGFRCSPGKDRPLDVETSTADTLLPAHTNDDPRHTPPVYTVLPDQIDFRQPAMLVEVRSYGKGPAVHRGHRE